MFSSSFAASLPFRNPSIQQPVPKRDCTEMLVFNFLIHYIY